jgi:hypothetical protein
MSNIVTDVALHYWQLGRKTKSTPSGWISANAVCCHSKGEKADTRMRGGIIATDAGGVSYSCFNCGFKTAWQPGWNLSYNMRLLLQWIGVPDHEISKLVLEVLRINNGAESREHVLLRPDFHTVALPAEAKPIAEYTEPSKHLQRVINYLKQRNYNIEDYNFHWSPQLKFRNRLIVPFYYHNKCVGWTSRTVDPNDKIKYISDQQPGYVFNMDAQDYDKLFCIVVEGPLDAIHLGAAALCGSSINEQQAYMLNSLHKQIIVLPDRDSAGSKLVEQAIEYGWSVSFPDWGEHIKDTGDAVEKYGRLYTLYSIVSATQNTELKIRLAAKRWFNN